MKDDAKVVQTSQGWFVETPEGRFGPMDSSAEANQYLSLLRVAEAAGSEVACTENECLN
ncbi:MAG: hypothetical protein PVF28_00010 [Thioalkalispiraceae bacterium]